jgi:hypothetical protein
VQGDDDEEVVAVTVEGRVHIDLALGGGGDWLQRVAGATFLRVCILAVQCTVPPIFCRWGRYRQQQNKRSDLRGYMGIKTQGRQTGRQADRKTQGRQAETSAAVQSCISQL